MAETKLIPAVQHLVFAASNARPELFGHNEKLALAIQQAVAAKCAEIAEQEAEKYRVNLKQCDAAGNRVGATNDFHGQRGCEFVKAAIRSTFGLEGK